MIIPGQIRSTCMLKFVVTGLEMSHVDMEKRREPLKWKLGHMVQSVLSN